MGFPFPRISQREGISHGISLPYGQPTCAQACFGPRPSPQLRRWAAACSWWVGTPINMNAKVRIHLNREKTVSAHGGVPDLAQPQDYDLARVQVRGHDHEADYIVNMDEVKTKYEFEGVKMTLVVRRYIVEKLSCYLAEIEFRNRLTDMKLRRVLDWAMNIVGSVRMIANEIDHKYISSARSVDHAVVDVSDMSMYKGVFMHKADWMKVYVCYSFGYVVMMTDNNLTVLTYRFTSSIQRLYKMTRMGLDAARELDQVHEHAQRPDRGRDPVQDPPLEGAHDRPQVRGREPLHGRRRALSPDREGEREDDAAHDLRDEDVQVRQRERGCA
ncbi:hypothetical protein CDV55_100043 [Aspergillus turcosus]|nr:hypothetical protein CDV55_100043 [Aspergillus turcosus]